MKIQSSWLVFRSFLVGEHCQRTLTFALHKSSLYRVTRKQSGISHKSSVYSLRIRHVEEVASLRWEKIIFWQLNFSCFHFAITSLIAVCVVFSSGEVLTGLPMEACWNSQSLRQWLVLSQMLIEAVQVLGFIHLQPVVWMVTQFW